MERAYSEGQIWEYETRAGDSGSLLKIQKIEPFPMGDEVFHISVIGVRLGKPGLQPVITHMPMSKEALNASVTRLFAGKADFPSAAEGISTWRQNNGGMFTIPVAKAVECVDDTSQHGERPTDTG